jgi:hypothetical protein
MNPRSQSWPEVGSWGSLPPLNDVECRVMENMARAVNEAASEQARLRRVTREMADYASLQIREQLKPPLHRLGNCWRMCSSSLHSTINRLEYFPDALQRRFQQLPPSNPIRIFWKAYIDRMIANNTECEQMIIKYNGSPLLTSNFREVCTDEVCTELLGHFRDWRTMWQFAVGENALPEDFNTTQMVRAFPEGADAVIVSKYLRVSSLVGSAREMN